MLFTDKYKRYIDNYGVTLTHGSTGDTVRGIYIGADHSHPFMAMYDSSGTVAQITQNLDLSKIGVDLASKVFSPSEKIGSSLVANTVKSYTGTGPFTLQLEMAVFNAGGQTLRSVMDLITSWTFPKITGGGLGSMGVMNSNLYDALAFTGSESLNGQLLSLALGKWFLTDAIFYPINLTPSFSKHVDSNGSPLWLNISVSLDSYRAIDNKTIAGWYLV